MKIDLHSFRLFSDSNEPGEYSLAFVFYWSIILFLVYALYK